MKTISTSLFVTAMLAFAPLAQAQQPVQLPKATQSAKPAAKSTAKPSATKSWKKGGKLPSPKSHAEIRDYGKRGLSAPGKGQRWVRVDSQYLLISAATGAILAVSQGR